MVTISLSTSDSYCVYLVTNDFLVFYIKRKYYYTTIYYYIKNEQLLVTNNLNKREFASTPVTGFQRKVAKQVSLNIFHFLPWCMALATSLDMNIELCFVHCEQSAMKIMTLRVCSLAEIKRYKSNRIQNYFQKVYNASETSRKSLPSAVADTNWLCISALIASQVCFVHMGSYMQFDRELSII